MNKSELRKKVNKDGRVTIPKSIRDILDLRAGDELEHRNDGDALVFLKKCKESSTTDLPGTSLLTYSGSERK